MRSKNLSLYPLFFLLLFISNLFAADSDSRPSTELRELLQGQIFVKSNLASAPKIEKLYKQKLINFHPDKISENDLNFIARNLSYFEAIYELAANTPVKSFAKLLLEEQKNTYLIAVKNTPGFSLNYCDFCDQVVEREFLRATLNNEHVYFHKSCLQSSGVSRAKAYYAAGDVQQFSLIANCLTDRTSSDDVWTFFIEEELKKKNYHNVFNNIDALFKGRACLGDAFFKKIAEHLLNEEMSVEVFLEQIKDKNFEGTQELARVFFDEMIFKSSSEALAMSIANKGAERFAYLKKRYFGNCDFIQKITSASKDFFDLHKHLVGPFLQKHPKEKICDFFTYAGYFNLFADKDPIEAKKLLLAYQRLLTNQRIGYCWEQIAENSSAIQNEALREAKRYTELSKKKY